MKIAVIQRGNRSFLSNFVRYLSKLSDRRDLSNFPWLLGFQVLCIVIDYKVKKVSKFIQMLLDLKMAFIFLKSGKKIFFVYCLQRKHCPSSNNPFPSLKWHLLLKMVFQTPFHFSRLILTRSNDSQQIFSKSHYFTLVMYSTLKFYQMIKDNFLTKVPRGRLTPAKPEYSLSSWWVLKSSSLSFLLSFSSRELGEEGDAEEDEDREWSCSLLLCLLQNK